LLQGVTETVLYEDAHTRITHLVHAQAKKQVACVFYPYSNRRLDPWLFGAKFLFEQGFDVISFAVTNDSWYQHFPTNLLSQIRQRLLRDYEKRIGYGGSMGGFASIAFSKVFDFHQVYVFSPQVAIHEPFDTRWKHRSDNIPWQYGIDINTVNLKTEYHVFFDPINADKLHVTRLSALLPSNQLITYPLPYAGHPVTHFLAETKALKPIMTDLLLGCQVDVKAIRQQKNQSVTYLNNLGHALLKCHRYALAESIFSRIVSRDQKRVGAFRSLALSQEKQARLDAAIETIERGVHYFPTHDALWMQKSRLSMRRGRLDAALDAIHRAILLNGQEAGFWLQAATVYEKLGEIELSLHAVRRGLALNVENPHLHARQASILLKQHAVDAALASINVARQLAPDVIYIDKLKEKILLALSNR